MRDKIFIHETKIYDEPCWEKIYTTNTYKYIIYPYIDGNLIDETSFKKNNPKTYEYLLSQKDELGNRDKGKIKYKNWYAYGVPTVEFRFTKI